MDAMDRFELDVCRALRERHQPAPAIRRTRAWRRGPAVALAALLVGGGAAVAGTQLVASGPVTPKTPQVAATDHFALLRRPATPQDHLTIGSGTGSPDDLPAGADSRLAFADGTVRVYAVDAGDGRICLVYRDQALGSTACTSTAQAMVASLPPELTINRVGGAAAYLLFPDGIGDVAVTTADGGQQTLPVKGNFVALPKGARAVRWRDTSGVEHELTNLSPQVIVR